MSVETITGASDVSDLNAAWPVDTDFFKEGAAHIRNTKQMMKNLFTGEKANVATISDNTSLLGGQLPSYYLDFNNFTNVPAGSAPPNNATITIDPGTDLTGGGAFSVDQAGNAVITLNHADTSSQGSVNNSGNTVVQDITLDGRGHITGITSKTLSIPSTQSTSVGAVGTYALCERTAQTTLGAGATISGSSLRYSSATGVVDNSPIPSGTWRCMGYVHADIAGGNLVTLFVRIS